MKTNLENAREAYYNKYYKPHLPNKKYNLLDLGCGEMNHTKYFDYEWCDAVDIRDIKLIGRNINFYAIDVMHYMALNINKKWDVIVILDLIEHIPKHLSIKLIGLAKEAANNCVLISTPDGFGPSGEFQNTKYLKHVCGFIEPELQNLGFDIFREKNGRFGMKEWHDKTNTPYPPSWDRLIGVYKP